MPHVRIASEFIRAAESSSRYGKFRQMNKAVHQITGAARKAFCNLSRNERESVIYIEELTYLLHIIYVLKEFFLNSKCKHQDTILNNLTRFEREVREAVLEALLIASPKHSKVFQMVVLRNGNGSSPQHYETVGSLHASNEIPSDILQAEMPQTDVEEFLTDEDYDPATNLREVAVREVRFGRKRVRASFQEVTTTQLVFSEE
jgi:hypothetical protein